MPNVHRSGFPSGFSDLHAGRVRGLWQLPGRRLVGKRPSPLADHRWGVAVQVEDDELADDRQHGEQDHRPHLHDARAAAVATSSERLNSSAMMTVKIMPNTVWKTTWSVGSKAGDTTRP